MKILKINAKEGTVTEIKAPMQDENCIDTDFMCDQIGCTMFTTVRLPNGDYLFVDDEGLLRSGMQPAFQMQSYPQPLVGNGLVIGGTPSGGSCEPKSSVKDIEDSIAFGWVPLEPAQEVKNN